MNEPVIVHGQNNQLKKARSCVTRKNIGLNQGKKEVMLEFGGVKVMVSDKRAVDFVH